MLRQFRRITITGIRRETHNTRIREVVDEASQRCIDRLFIHPRIGPRQANGFVWILPLATKIRGVQKISRRSPA